MNLVLIGFMGVGKTSVGKGLAESLGRLTRGLGLARLPIPINLGDLFTTFARKGKP